MKGTVAAGAILGVLAIGGVPAFALTMVSEGPLATGTAGPTAGPESWQPGDGAPPWSNGRHRAKTHHGAQMRVWAHCLAGAEKPSDDASHGATGDGAEDAADWKKACGPKPTPPGHLKHAGR